MGVYIYKLTAKVVTLEDGTTAQVAKFAYKPSWSNEAYNRKAAFRTGVTRNITVKADYVALLNDDGTEAEVFANLDDATVFYDTDFGTKKYPGVGKIAVRRLRTRKSRLDALVRYHTAFTDFADMLNTHSTYRPSLATGSASTKTSQKELTAIADAYDSYMIAQGDIRRAYRY